MDSLIGLSNRERDVVKLLLEGKSNKQIAFSLHITEHTVEFHLKNIYSKYQVSSRTELIIKLRKSVVVDKGEETENRETQQSTNWYASLRDTISRIGKELKMESSSVSNASSGATSVTFFEAIIIGFKKYAEFNGRASRSEFWWFFLFILLAASAFAYVSETLVSIFLIATLLPLLAAGARRLNDIGKSRWWLLYLFSPGWRYCYTWFFVGAAACQPSTRGYTSGVIDSLSATMAMAFQSVYSVVPLLR